MADLHGETPLSLLTSRRGRPMSPTASRWREELIASSVGPLAQDRRGRDFQSRRPRSRSAAAVLERRRLGPARNVGIERPVAAARLARCAALAAHRHRRASSTDTRQPLLPLPLAAQGAPPLRCASRTPSAIASAGPVVVVSSDVAEWIEVRDLRGAREHGAVARAIRGLAVRGGTLRYPDQRHARPIPYSVAASCWTRACRWSRGRARRERRRCLCGRGRRRARPGARRTSSPQSVAIGAVDKGSVPDRFRARPTATRVCASRGTRPRPRVQRRARRATCAPVEGCPRRSRGPRRSSRRRRARRRAAVPARVHRCDCRKLDARALLLASTPSASSSGDRREPRRAQGRGAAPRAA